MDSVVDRVAAEFLARALNAPDVTPDFHPAGNGILIFTLPRGYSFTGPLFRDPAALQAGLDIRALARMQPDETLQLVFNEHREARSNAGFGSTAKTLVRDGAGTLRFTLQIISWPSEALSRLEKGDTNVYLELLAPHVAQEIYNLNKPPHGFRGHPVKSFTPNPDSGGSGF